MVFCFSFCPNRFNNDIHEHSWASRLFCKPILHRKMMIRTCGLISNGSREIKIWAFGCNSELSEQTKTYQFSFSSFFFFVNYLIFQTSSIPWLSHHYRVEDFESRRDSRSKTQSKQTLNPVNIRRINRSCEHFNTDIILLQLNRGKLNQPTNVNSDQ